MGGGGRSEQSDDVWILSLPVPIPFGASSSIPTEGAFFKSLCWPQSVVLFLKLDLFYPGPKPF